MSRLVIVFLALIALTGGAQAETRKIRIGTEGTYRPFSYFDAEGKLTGFEVELDRAICAAVKADCEFVTMEFDGLIPALQEKKIDAVASGRVRPWRPAQLRSSLSGIWIMQPAPSPASGSAPTAPR